MYVNLKSSYLLAEIAYNTIFGAKNTVISNRLQPKGY
jgi:hypothetical protein